MAMFQLQLEQFSGPIEKLLEFIEEKKLEITELSLAEITADFIKYLNGLNKQIESGSPVNSRILADFIVIASRLLLIKSKALLPNFNLTSEEEKEIKDLENRLKLYQQFKPAIYYLKNLWEKNNFSISRPLFAGRAAFFYPAENITIESLKKSIAAVFEVFEELTKKTQSIKSSHISLEEKIQEVLSRLKKNLKFNKLTEEKTRPEIIVLFLAVLYLLGKQVIKVEQKEKFSDIMIEKKE